jgi:hypothetical protein
MTDHDPGTEPEQDPAEEWDLSDWQALAASLVPFPTRDLERFDPRDLRPWSGDEEEAEVVEVDQDEGEDPTEDC